MTPPVKGPKSEIGERCHSPTITVVYAGGTIGMKAGPNGYAPNPDFGAWLDEWIDRQPELRGLDLRISIVDPVLDSSDATPRDWLTLSETIDAEASEADAVIVLHGTDTMAYAASGASFLLHEIDKPIIFTGSLVPAVYRGSDAGENLRGAIRCARAGVAREVSIFFDGALLRANRTTKVGTSEQPIFASPHWPALDQKTDRLEFTIRAQPKIDRLRPIRVRDMQLPAIGVLKLFPGLDLRLLLAATQIYHDGLVLELYGSGNGPGANVQIMSALRKVSDAGVPLIGVSQCPFGKVEPGTYVSGQSLLDSGIIAGFDLTTEAALTKLTCLRWLSTPERELPNAIQTPFAGEVTSKSMLSPEETFRKTGHTP